jgi:hypothetical protein
VTRRPHGAKPLVKGAQGPASRPHFESVQAGTWQLRSHINLEEDHVPKSQWKQGGEASLQTDLMMLVEAPFYPYRRITMVEFTPTTLFL